MAIDERILAVVFDLEYTAWEGSLERNWSRSDEQPEIIQIGGVKIYRKNGHWRHISEFNEYVKPTLKPKLSKYIKDLTGITQEIIEEKGITLNMALQRFDSFIPQNALLCTNGNDQEILNWNCRHLDIENPLNHYNHINVRPFLANRMHVSETDLRLHSYRLAELDTISDSVPHDALWDARCIARALMTLEWNN